VHRLALDLLDSIQMQQQVVGQGEALREQTQHLLVVLVDLHFFTMPQPQPQQRMGSRGNRLQ
jgi:hypothetical protein